MKNKTEETLKIGDRVLISHQMWDGVQQEEGTVVMYIPDSFEVVVKMDKTGYECIDTKSNIAFRQSWKKIEVLSK